MDSSRQLESAAGGTLLQGLFAGRGIEASDLGMLGFVTISAVLSWVAYERNSFWFALPELALDVVWLGMQILTWWIPYIFGINRSWQLAYANGPTTKVLPSFGHHVAPDGMHFVIHVLLASALITGLAGLRQIKLARRKQPEEVPGWRQQSGSRASRRPLHHGLNAPCESAAATPVFALRRCFKAIQT